MATATALAAEGRPAQLSDAQERALGRIEQLLAAGGGNVLLEGATGSGKTEVYIRACEAALVRGRSAIVLDRIVNDDAAGTVRLEGEVWTARAYDEDAVIEPGTRVQVVEIRGATALVAP